MVKRMHNIWNINNIWVPGDPDANPPVPDVAAIQKTSTTFQTINGEFLENIKQGFK